MPCAQCDGIESEFGGRVAQHDLRRFRRRGARGTTRVLIDALRDLDVSGAAVLDIGGGIGTIHHVLLDEGAARATHVDASSAYLTAAREEAARRGHGSRVEFRHGDFVDLAPTIAAADVVTLDRVICCYPDMRALVGRSAERARRAYGLVYPRDHWLMRALAPVANLYFRLKRSPFRTFIHRTRDVEAVAAHHGLHRHITRRFWMWQVTVFVRDAGNQRRRDAGT